MVCESQTDSTTPKEGYHETRVYAGGSVTLDGGGSLTTPGRVATLDGVSGLTLVSPDADHWSVALLRLAADSPTPDLGLTLLAFGNVEIRNLTQFDAAAGNGDGARALSFSSSPVPGEEPETGGLIVYNPTHEEPLSISLNGADLTLASSPVVQAQLGVNMTVTMATGSGLVNTAADDNVPHPPALRHRLCVWVLRSSAHRWHAAPI